MLKKITSTQNPLIKYVLQLQEKSKVRKREQRFLIEGIRELKLATENGYKLDKVLFDHTIISQEKVLSEIATSAEVIEVSNTVYKKIAFRGSTEGVIAIALWKNLTIDHLQLGEKPLLLVAEAPEKPGNIGALLRTADAAGIDAVLIANPKTDMYNPNIIRSSVGGVFTTKIATGTSSEIIDFLKRNAIHIYVTSLEASVAYDTLNYTKPTAIIVGTEATGITEEWLEHSSQNIIIPMRGKLDSMNVSVSAAIIIFEAVRQRHCNLA